MDERRRAAELNMNLAVILGVCWLSLGPPQNAAPSQPQASQQQASPQQSSEPAQAAPAPTSQAPNPTDQTKPSATPPAKRRRHKRPTPADCSNITSTANATGGDPADPKNSAGTASTNTNSTALPPCPPPKKVVHNGGSEEPAIQLVGGATDEQTVHQRSTDQLTAATEENLKKIAGRQLSPNQQEMVSQIKQFMDQSKTAIAGGDLERGHNLALKAHLLSDELIKP
ncbi:MAG TPA: hypothetical protein VN310_18560 [Candidatus Dormibacteraeota bacterium]|jgi:hypothetical protein|nr:hypothetical protein [Candidatus Dormibacteraeota bacterium]